MLLRLVPQPPFPTVLFTLAFPQLPDDLPLPASWAHTVDLLQTHDLPPPPSAHALDVSTSHVALLEVVTFDLAKRVLTCTWIDGHSARHELTESCVAALEDVIADVSLASVEAQREQHRERHPDAEVPPAPPSSLNKPPSVQPAAHTAKHKRRRSTFFSMVSAILSSSSSTSTTDEHLHTTSISSLAEDRSALVPDPVPEPEPVASSITEARVPPGLAVKGPRSRFLRRRARSLLVDSFRRFVLPLLTPPPLQDELEAHTPTPSSRYKPGYDTWTITSLIRRTNAQAIELLERARPVAQRAGCVPGDRHASSESFRSGSSDDDGLYPWPYPDEDDSDEMEGSDSDGALTADDSSVDTPREGEVDVFVRAYDDEEDDDPFYAGPAKPASSRLPMRTHRRRTPRLTPVQVARAELAALAAEYRALHTHAGRLRVLRSYLESQRDRAQAEERAYAAALEERALRRACSSLARRPPHVEWTKPASRSPLARSFSAHEVEFTGTSDEFDERRSLQEDGRARRRSLGMRRTKSTWDVRPRVYHRAAVVASASRRAAAAFEMAQMEMQMSVPFPCGEDECDDVEDGYPFPEDAFDMVISGGDQQFSGPQDDVFFRDEEDDGVDLASPVDEYAPHALPRRSLELDLPASGRPHCIPADVDADPRSGTRAHSGSSLLRAAVRKRLPSISFLRRQPSDECATDDMQLPVELELPRFSSAPPVSPPRSSVRGMLASLSGHSHGRA